MSRTQSPTQTISLLHHQARYISFLTFKNLEKSVAEDVERIRKHPLVNPKIIIYGYICFQK